MEVGLHSLKVAQLLRSAACLHTNQSRSYLNHLVLPNPLYDPIISVYITLPHRTEEQCKNLHVY